MTNEQLVILLKNQVRLLEQALQEADEGMVGVDRHKKFIYIGSNMFWFSSGISSEDHRAKHPLQWSEEQGSVIALDPIKEEIDNMNELIETLEVKNET